VNTITRADVQSLADAWNETSAPRTARKGVHNLVALLEDAEHGAGLTIGRIKLPKQRAGKGEVSDEAIVRQRLFLQRPRS
jgi:hypothetical protein